MLYVIIFLIHIIYIIFIKFFRFNKCKDIFNGLSYYDLDLELEEDQEKLKILKILVPQRIIEPEIK